MIKNFIAWLKKKLSTVKWRWWFVYPIYTAVIYLRFFKLFGSPFLGAVVLCIALLVLSHFLRKTEKTATPAA